MSKKTQHALHRPNDTLQFTAAVDWCQTMGLPVVRCSDYQLKCGPWNFYTKGTFHHDGDSDRCGNGFMAFKLAIESWLKEQGLSEALKRYRSEATFPLQKS